MAQSQLLDSFYSIYIDSGVSLIDEEIQDKLINKAKEIFGTTESCKRAGYILPDGEMLDFGNPDPRGIVKDKYNEHRYQDHSEVWQVYSHFPEIKTINPEKKGQCFVSNYNDQWLKETGAIRFNNAHYNMNGEMFQPHTPTKKQLEALEFCSCTTPQNGKIIMEFSKCTEKGEYIPKNFSEERFTRDNDCVEPIKRLKSAIKKWKEEVVSYDG